VDNQQDPWQDLFEWLCQMSEDAQTTLADAQMRLQHGEQAWKDWKNESMA
jgi:hypothetical protein